MKKKNNPEYYTPSGNAFMCNNKDCILKESCFRFLEIKTSKDWKEGKNKCINYVHWDRTAIKQLEN